MPTSALPGGCRLHPEEGLSLQRRKRSYNGPAGSLPRRKISSNASAPSMNDTNVSQSLNNEPSLLVQLPAWLIPLGKAQSETRDPPCRRR